MVQVGVGQHRILTHDVHATNASGMGRLHDLNGSESDLPGKRLKRNFPYRGQFLSLGIVGDWDISRKGHRHAAHADHYDEH